MFARLVVLLAVTLLATQIVGGTLFFLFTPPPGMLVIHLSEIADRLQAGRGAAAPSIEAQKLGPDHDRLTDLEPLLAARLGISSTHVRLWQEGPPFLATVEPDRTSSDPVILGGYMAAINVDGQWRVVRDNPHDTAALLGRMGLWLIVTLVCIAPVAVLLGARLTSPITAFATAAEGLGRDPYAPPMRETGPAEVVLAIKAFNEMQGRLRAYIDDRVRMVGAIAHDLRTPLTRLRLQLEALPPVAHERSVAEIERMNRMVEGALAFVKDSSALPERTPLYFLSLVEAVANDMAVMGALIEVEAGLDPVILGDEGGLRRMVGNLIDNALIYGGIVQCRVDLEQGWAVLEIDDQGPGLAEADLGRVFEPYVRLGDQPQGIGLGLSIVQGIVKAHGGDVTLSNRQGGGLRARVRLPMAA